MLFSINYFWISIHSYAQSNVANKYGLFIVSDLSSFKNSIAAETNKCMVNILNCSPRIILDLKYETSNNFYVIKIVSARTTTYLRSAAMLALQKVAA